MPKYILTAITAGAVAATGLAMAGGAAAAPTGAAQVDQTVRALQARGYNVIINRTGDAPQSECTVSAVRPGQTHSTVDSRGGSSPRETVLAQTVYVDVAC